MATNNSSNYQPTQYNVLSGGASGAINNIAPSTSGYVLTSNGASAQPTFQVLPAISYGMMSLYNSGSAVTLTTPGQNVFAEITGLSTSFVLQGSSSDVQMTTDGRLKYTVSLTRTFKVSYNVTLVPNGSAGGCTVSLFQGGVQAANTNVSVNGTTSYNGIQLGIKVTLATNDYVSIFVSKASSGTTGQNQSLYFAQISMDSVT